MRSISTTVYMHEEQRKALRELSIKTGIPIAVMVRAGIDIAIEKFRKLKLDLTKG